MAANTCSQPQEFENGTGAVSNYTLNFEYINREDVLVFVGTEPPYTQYTLGNSANANEYEWINDSTIRLNAVSGVNNVVFVRVTDRCDPIVEFFAGTSIRAQDLNDNQEQVLFLIQEIVGSLRNAGLDVQLPNDKILLNDLGDVDVAGAGNRSYLAFNGTNWEDAAVIRSSDNWVSNDSAIATTKAGDERWLNSDGSDVTAGAGLNKDTSTARVVKLEADLLANGGLTTTPAGDSGELRVVQGTGVTINASGVNAGVTTIDVVGTSDPDIRLTETLAGTATNTDIGIKGGTNIDVTASGDDITIATSAGLLTDAPNDGNLYGRRNQAWAVVTGGGSSEGVEIVAHTRALNAAAGNLDANDAGAVYLVQDSTNIDGTVGTPGADNPAPAPAVAGLPAAPTGGWDDTVQTAVQWTGTAWTFIRYQASSPDQRYVKLVDGTPNNNADRQTIRWNGLDLLCAGPNNTIATPYELRISSDGNRTPQMSLNAGSTENATLQVAFGDQGGGTTTHGVYISSGDSLNEHGSVRCTGDDNRTSTVFSYTNVLGATSAQNQFFLKTNGDFETTGNIILESTNARVNVPAFGLTIGATPTEDYSITFPAAGPTQADQVLISDDNGQLAWGASAAGLWELSSGNLQPITDGQGIVIRNDQNTQKAAITSAGVISGTEVVTPKVNAGGSNNLSLDATGAGQVIIAEAGIVAGSSAHNVPNNSTDWDIQDSNVWNVPAGANIQFPNTAPVARQPGLFVMAAGTVTWTGAGWIGPSGTLPTTFTAGTIVPFYVESGSVIRIGNPTAFS